MIYIFDWLGDFIGGIGSAIGGVFDYLGEQISNAIWNTMIQWLYETIYNAVADFFTMMGNMGADVFDLEWVQATINLFTLFGWALFVAGTVVAVFDVAVEYQNGRANIKTTAINVLKGFFACSLFGVVPVELYKFCISLQNIFSKDLSSIMAGQQSIDLAGQSTSVLEGSFAVANQTTFGLLNLLCMIAFAYCVIKIFFANIKRGGILLIQMAVGALYMFSVPRGYQDGFNQWMKQIAALCLTAFMQTTLLFLGLLTFPGNMLLGLGIMLASNEVPRIAQQFGLDSSVKEYTKPLFSIPTHHFLFYPGNINPKDFEDALMVEPNEYALIKFGERGTCLYRCGNERYLLLVQAPEYNQSHAGRNHLAAAACRGNECRRRSLAQPLLSQLRQGNQANGSYGGIGGTGDCAKGHAGQNRYHHDSALQPAHPYISGFKQTF